MKVYIENRLKGASTERGGRGITEGRGKRIRREYTAYGSQGSGECQALWIRCGTVYSSPCDVAALGPRGLPLPCFISLKCRPEEQFKLQG